jgi:hypothetical protein
MASAEVSERIDIDTLDLTGYRCVYISFGSKEHPDITNPKPFYQKFPFFLEFINKYPLCAISIDQYDAFEKEEEDVPFDTWGVKPRKKYTRVDIPTRTMAQTIQITQQLVELLRKYKPEQVFFVNFIKYQNKDAHDAGPEQEAVAIERHLGEYRDNYYEWYGFTLFRDFILKNPSRPIPIYADLKKVLAARDTPNNPFLKLLKNDDKLREKIRPELYEAIRTFFIDITPDITPNQYNLLDVDLAEFSGGKRTRKRRRKRRTRR